VVIGTLWPGRSVTMNRFRSPGHTNLWRSFQITGPISRGSSGSRWLICVGQVIGVATLQITGVKV